MYSSKKRSGFTLIELMVVIGIMGILASVILLAVNQARANSRDSRRVSDLKQLELGLALYREQSGTYPTATQFYNNGTSVLVPTFVPKMPLDPRTKAAYTYNLNSSGFLITTTLEAENVTTCYVKAPDRTAPTGSTAPCDNL